MAKKRFTRVRRGYARAKRSYSRRKSISGFASPLITGAVIGAGLRFASPYINSYVPRVGPISGTTIATGAGAMLLKMSRKGGNWSNGLMLVTGMSLSNDLLGAVYGGNGATVSNGNGASILNQ